MGGDRCHHGVLGNIFVCQLCFWPWQHRGVLPTEMQARGGQEGRATSPALQPPGKEPQQEPFLTAIPSPQTCPRLCERPRPRQRRVPAQPRSHTHNPRVTGDTKELPRCWEPGRGQEGRPGRAGSAAVFLSHWGPPSVFSLLIPPFNPFSSTRLGQGIFLSSPSFPGSSIPVAVGRGQIQATMSPSPASR